MGAEARAAMVNVWWFVSERARVEVRSMARRKSGKSEICGKVVRIFEKFENPTGGGKIHFQKEKGVSFLKRRFFPGKGVLFFEKLR
jgi:hypothetical protein